MKRIKNVMDGTEVSFSTAAFQVTMTVTSISSNEIRLHFSRPVIPPNGRKGSTRVSLRRSETVSLLGYGLLTLERLGQRPRFKLERSNLQFTVASLQPA